MQQVLHPSKNIPTLFAESIRDAAAEAESLRHLHPAQLNLAYRQKWFQLFVPKVHGGLELSLPEALRLEESIAWMDGSLGWTVTLCAGAGWFIGFLDPGIVPDFFNHDTICLAGSGKPTGRASIRHEGFEINGRWDYASGADIATAFTANCILEEHGRPLVDATGHPVIMPFIFRREEVRVDDNWRMMGMIASASHSFEVRNVIVKTNRAFRIEAARVVMPQPVYHYPFLQLAETTLAVNTSGMAIRFLDLCKERLLDSKTLGAMLRQGSQSIDQARSGFYEAVDASWESGERDSVIGAETLIRVSAASRHLASRSRSIVDELYPLCGMYAANPATEINRVWRNLHTASQHSLLSGRREQE